MSRSFKRHPGGGHTVAESDKPYKVIEHRRERRQVSAAIRRGDDAPVVDYGNPYRAPKDGKQFWLEHDARWMRK